MAAVQAPAEAPIETPEVPAAEPVTEAPPTPADEPEGDAAPEAEGGKDYSAVEEELEAEVERRLEARADKLAQAAAEKTVQRMKEADDGESARLNLYAVAETKARESAATLRQMAQNGELDDDTLTQHMNPILAGVQALTAKENEGLFSKYDEQFLADLTEAEKETLEPHDYERRRNGRLEQAIFKRTELLVARKDAEIADLKKQLGDRKAIKAAAEKLSGIAEAAGNGVGAETPKGKATKQGPLTIEEAQTLPIDELIRRSKAQ